MKIKNFIILIFIILGIAFKAYSEEEIYPTEKFGNKLTYTLKVLETDNKYTLNKAISDVRKKDKDIPVYIRETIIEIKKRLYILYIGEFQSKDEAQKLSLKLFKKEYPIEELALEDLKIDEKDGYTYLISSQGWGELNPKADNKIASNGTKDNRRAEVRLIPLTSQLIEKEVSLNEVIGKGIYKITFKSSYLYPLDEIYDFKIYFDIPKNLSYMSNSATLNGEAVEVSKKGQFYVISKEKIDGQKPINIEMKFFLPDETKATSILYVVYGKTKNGKVIEIFSSANKEIIKETKRYYTERQIDNPQNITLESVKQTDFKAKYSISYPERDIIQSEKQTDIKINIPALSKYEVKVNDKSLSESSIGETDLDSSLNLRSIHYVGIPLEIGENIITLYIDGNRLDERKILITGDISNLKYSIYPEKPPADGRTPIYVVIELLDKDGNLVKQNSYLNAYVDKGDIFDYETNEFKRVIDDKFKIRVMAGKGIIKLSPASTTQTRRLVVTLGNMKREIDIKFYPEQRGWIVVGDLEAGVGFNQKSNNSQKISDMPFDHTSKDDINVNFEGGLFTKGSIKDYTLTLRYITQKQDPFDNTLLQQNIPSTEEGEFYPVYGDESEPFFEAQSRTPLYVKLERNLSYGLYGDFNTEFGTDLEFNIYNRTLNGGLVNLEGDKNYKLRSFLSQNNQSMVREEIKGRGISGPYYLKNNEVVEFSEKVTIETRDRYNNNIIITQTPLNRFTDYTINYDEGWIIFKSPIYEFDNNFNPQYIEIVYETKNLSEDRYMYGARGEKYFFDGKLRFGLSGTREEHDIKDKDLYGGDIVYTDGNLKIVGEMAKSENLDTTDLSDTSGIAGKVEATYQKDKSNAKVYYKKVEDGFQNLSSSTANMAYDTYGASTQLSLNKDKTTLRTDIIVEESALERKKVEGVVDQKITDKLGITAGYRWNEEELNTDDTNAHQVISGVNYNPIEKLSLGLMREQTVYGDNNSLYYPTRTIGKIGYSITKSTNAYVQTELQELEDKNLSLTTVGLDSNITENTTAYSKYTIDDSVSGWRNQSHLGINHNFIVKDGFTLDGGLENVETLSSENEDETQDYTAARFGLTYLQKDFYKITGRYEIRYGTEKIDHLLMTGGSVKIAKDYTLFLNERFFNSVYPENDLLFGLAFRPVSWDKLNYITKFRWKIKDDIIDETKYIGSLHINYQPHRIIGLMSQYAFKITDISDLGRSFTDLIRGRILWDITKRFDFNIHGGLLTQHNTNTYTLAYGPELGTKVIENIWFSVGYNFSGFYDEDFGEANYWDKGFYLKLRIKFDENTFKKIKN